MSNTIKDMLNFDPLQAAENLTGRSYKDDPITGHVGMAISIDANAKKNEVLKNMGDSTFITKTDDYLPIIESLGFKKVFEEQFKGHYYNKEHGYKKDAFYIYATEDGLILKFDTYGDSINSSTLYYATKERVDLMASGGRYESGEGFYYMCNVDAREAIRYKVGEIRKHEILTVWPKRPFLWFLNYKESHTHSDNYEKITNERIAKLPEWVQKIIN